LTLISTFERPLSGQFCLENLPSKLYPMHSSDTCRQKREEARQAEEWKQKKWQKDHAYDAMFAEEHMEASSNQNRSADWEDDFM
jgi:hypothetical protein